MPLPVRRDSNYGDYSIEKVHRLGFIRRARNLGFSMVQIRDLLRLWDDEGRLTRDVKALTLAHIDELNGEVLESVDGGKEWTPIGGSR